MITFIDSHAHLNDEAFNEDREQVINACFDAGVKQIIEIACETNEWQPAAQLCEKYKGQIYAAASIHPINVEQFTDESFENLKHYLTLDNFRAVGEIGLDYFYEDSAPRTMQQEVFERQLILAQDIKKPIILHCRKGKDQQDYSAYEDMFFALKKYNLSGGILHCFSGRKEDAYRALDMGFYLGINGIIGYKKNEDVRQIIRQVGLKYLVLETDCPYLPPQSKRGQRNSPVNIPEIAQTLADILGKNINEVADITTQNAKAFYNI
ncbi:MAG: TatD family hydrolase [Elusimicrobiaceae bacterium]|nr:TatD family hydrolase [Elusimicrobiaceae bacterium]